MSLLPAPWLPNCKETAMPSTASVRLALPTEAGAVAQLQRDAWARDYGDAFVAQLDTIADLATATEQWRLAIAAPPLATQRVLVALQPGVAGPVGFAVTGPSPDPDATAGEDGIIGEFALADGAIEAGDADRLMTACVDTLRADGFQMATWWLKSDDDTLRALADEAGWAADGAHRQATLPTGESVKFVRLHTDISAAPEA